MCETPENRLLPDSFRTASRMVAPDWAEKSFVFILPIRWTADSEVDHTFLDLSAAHDSRPQMIPRQEVIPKFDSKWSQTPKYPDEDRKWSRRQMGMKFGFLDFLNYSFHFFHWLNDKLDQIKEKIYWQREL